MQLQKNGIPTKWNLHFGANWGSHNTKLLPKDFYNQIVWKVDDIVLNVALETVKAIDGKSPIQFGPEDLVCGGQWLFKVLSFYCNFFYRYTCTYTNTVLN